ncbi:MAG: GNAT family N-acetyltransferase [Defluviitaleaceae bacterium]|nr:GNAT family N-acetyltransferase [Defluviitaleaceae bacterium]
MELIELDDAQLSEIEDALEEYDNNHIKHSLTGQVRLGITLEGELIAGVHGVVTTFSILYISTLWVDESFRGKRLGKRLITELEGRVKNMGVNTLRADTFGFQGVDFYRSLGFTEVGSYTNEKDGYSEHFFVKQF